MIEGGAQFAKSIRQALDAADACVLWSKSSIESDWVCDEAAQGRERRRLVPLSLDGSLPPLGFRQYQTIDLARWRGRADAPQIDAIRRGIAVALGKQPVAPHTAGSPVSRRMMACGAGAGGVCRGGLIPASGRRARESQYHSSGTRPHLTATISRLSSYD